MFGSKKEIQKLLEVADNDRKMFVEQAEKDRAVIVEGFAAMQRSTEIANEEKADNSEENKSKIETVLELSTIEHQALAEQAEKDRKCIVECFSHVQKIVEDTMSKEEKENNKSKSEDEIKKAAHALNLCTVSVSQIVDYNDLIIMEQEYDTILNNLNLENFPKDEALLNILKQILDVICFFKIQDGEKKLQEEEYKKKMKDAIWSAVPSPSVILAGGKAGWAGLAVSTVAAVGTGYMNYRKERANIDAEKRSKDWELQKSAMEQFDALRRELFDTAWRLADIYNFPDNYRLTARQITQYNKILEDKDCLRRYERLEYIAEKFEAYPPFWYYLGHAAAEVCYDQNTYSQEVRNEYQEKALDAFEKFLVLTDDSEDMHSSLLREDQLRAACALEKFALISDDNNIELEVKVKLLQTAAKNAGNAFDTLQMCATYYLKIEENEEAVKLLRMLVNENYNAESNAQILSIQYVVDVVKNNVERKSEYETLAKRNFENYMFPYPEKNDVNMFSKFVEQQNNFLFDEYKKAMKEYIEQCAETYGEVCDMQGDISEKLVEFLMKFEKDIAELFDENVAVSLRDGIVEQLGKELDTHRTWLQDEAERKNQTQLYFEPIFGKAFEKIASLIKKQVQTIRDEKDEKKMSVISKYMSKLLLFKERNNLYSTAFLQSVSGYSGKDPFEKLRKASGNNKILNSCTRIVNDVAEKSLLISGKDKKHSARFIVENVVGSYFFTKKNRDKFKKIETVFAVLDTDKTDLVFTTNGIVVVRSGFNALSNDYEPIDYSKFNLVSGKLVIKGKNITFSDDNVNADTLINMIRDLEKAMPNDKVTSASKAFEEKLGNFQKQLNVVAEINASENNLLAMTSLLYYIAKADGEISKAKMDFLDNTLNPIFRQSYISNDTIKELKKIKESSNPSFATCRIFLKNVSLNDLGIFNKKIKELIGISGAPTEAVCKAEHTFLEYYEMRKAKLQK